MNSNPPVIQSQEISSSSEISTIIKNEKKYHFPSILLIFVGLSVIVGNGIWFVKNSPDKKFCLFLATGLAITLNGLLVNTKWKSFAFWTGLTLIGQSVALQMIDAGQTIHFQHYFSLSELFKNDLVSVILFVGISIFVVFGISFHLKIVINWLFKTFSWWQILLICAFSFLAGAAVTRDISIYASSLLISAFVQLINLANILLAVFAIPENKLGGIREKVERIFLKFEETENIKWGVDRFAIFSAFWIVLISALLSFFVYQRHPHVPDEVIYLFQAKYMAAGQLTSKAPLVPEAFSIYMIPTQDSRWFSIFPPAWSALLAIGMEINLEWLVNPLLAGVCVLLSYIFFTDLYSRKFARIAVFLLCCSPWFIFMSMSFMSHIFTLVCALCAAVLLIRAFRHEKVVYGFGAGIFVGVLSLIRPLDGAMIAFLLGIWTLISCPTWKSKILISAALVFGTILTASLIFPYNQNITGNPLLLPTDAYYNKYYWKNIMALGFGADRGFGWELDALPGHSPLEALINSALNIFSLNIELFGWGFGSLILISGFLVSGKINKKDFWAVAVIIMVAGGYGFFWYHGGPDFGARYWFLCIIPLIALTVRGMEWLSENIEIENNEPQTNIRLILSIVLLCVISLICYLPWRSVDKYYHYLGMRPDILKLAQQNKFGKSLVFIRGNEHPDYQSTWIYNPVNFEGNDPIYVWDKDPIIHEQVLKSYPDRQVWIVNSPSITGGSYEIAQEPVKTEELLKSETK